MAVPRWAATLLLVALVSGGCGAAGSTPDTSSPSVLMLDNRFSPVEVEVAVGATVEFVGAGRNPHNAVAADGSWTTEDSFGGLEQFEGDAALVTFTERGTYVFFCTFHGNGDGKGMAGTLTVVEKPSGN